MKRQLVKILGPAERDMLEPHIEAVRRFERVVQALAPESGLQFDNQALAFYRLVEEAPAPTNGTNRIKGVANGGG